MLSLHSLLCGLFLDWWALLTPGSIYNFFIFVLPVRHLIGLVHGKIFFFPLYNMLTAKVPPYVLLSTSFFRASEPSRPSPVELFLTTPLSLTFLSSE